MEGHRPPADGPGIPQQHSFAYHTSSMQPPFLSFRPPARWLKACTAIRGNLNVLFQVSIPRPLRSLSLHTHSLGRVKTLSTSQRVTGHPLLLWFTHGGPTDSSLLLYSFARSQVSILNLRNTEPCLELGVPGCETES